jgi:uncharacterized protein HemX
MVVTKATAGIAGAIILALSAALAVQTIRLADERTEHAETRAERERINAAAIRAALDASESYRQLEDAQAKKAEELRHAHEVELRKHQRIAAALRADRQRLRDELTAGPPGGEAAEPAAAGHHEQAEPLGSVLARSLQLQEDLAELGERDAAIARGLQAERGGLTCRP